MFHTLKEWEFNNGEIGAFPYTKGCSFCFGLTSVEIQELKDKYLKSTGKLPEYLINSEA